MAGERILVCDDGKESRDFIVEYILQPNSYQPLVARHGLEALEVARSEHPDLILLDLQMPKMNGMQVLDALKEEELDIPVVLMTFHGSEEIAIEVYRRGVHDYVKKPFAIEEMLWAIERTLAEVRLRKDKEALTDRLIAANADMNQRIRELNTLYQIGKSVTALVGLEELFSRVVRAAIEITDSDAGSLYLLRGEELVCRALKPSGDAPIRLTQQVVNDPFAWRAIQIGKPFALGPAEMKAHRQQNPNVPTSILVTPLVVGERAIGTLSVSNTNPQARTFRKQDAAMLTALADYASIAIENATNFAELARLKEREVSKIRAGLQRFMPTSLLDKALSGNLPQIDSVRAEVGVLLAQLTGYESHLARTQPDQVVNMLNHYLEMANGIVESHGGTVERYMGDGLIAYFNVPESQENYTMRMLQAALALQNVTSESTDNVQFSIGIHAGRAVVGNVGAVRGVGISAVGDVMRAVQQVQEKASSGQILVTEDLIAKIEEKKVQATYLGQISVQNRQQRLNVYEVTAMT